jgi:DnaJ-class molecular chaperone with C-terminal Zn finger domain
MPELPDHYATLGLDRRCTDAQIRTAYRLLARQFHPDVCGNSPEATRRIQELNAAFEVLSDPARRRAYDLERADRRDGKKSAARIKRDISHDVHLTVEEFLRGATLQVRVKDPVHPHGEEIYSLVVPPLTAPGTRFRLPREAPFEGGHVIVRLRVRPNARFKARGSDLRCDLRISARRAASGGTETIPGPDGRLLRVTIPAGAGRGEIVRVPGAGLPKSHGGRGDLLVRLSYRPEVTVTRKRFGFR